ncbi:MAG: xanthine dehydrogenase family protein molybdopterin-binding subunit [Reyranella sp.]|uniref:xanthine dehydrogenase family protein molybdopterin-binding subunit n=1 Tax=Reyranella sp. TaxID=1929291 RepID=UPI0025CFF432|nr:xanthine dehydrogenase family protein molybdopterin-binding subunit [Reyranella sp.]MBR2817466.1 xanthine dehydrogenase family protein molybdopterin-binding subunit [Reyranella sp.]
MSKYGIGQPVLRFEDPKLLRGQGRYINDVNLPGQAYAVFVRSPHAHAKILRIDTAVAAEAPGVLAVYTGHDVIADGLGMPKANMPRKRPDGKPMFAPQRPALIVDRVRYVGDPVAMVVANSLAEAKDAAELVEIEYEALPSVTLTEDTVKPGAPAVWDDCPDNISNYIERGNKAATDEAIRNAAKVIKRRYVITRVHAQYMEPRGTLGTYDQGEDRMTLYADVQYPHRVRNMLAQNVFKVPESKMRVIAGDVGGGFGTKGWQYVEHRLTLWAARKLLRPVKWTCERSEAVMADEHGRDNVGELELALDKDNRFVALRLNMLANIGAYVGSDRNLLSPFGMIGTVLGVYLIPTAYINVVGVLSNTNPTAPYRGAGRPEAIYLIERLIDDAARELGIDRVELRRRNLLPESAMPYQSPVGPFYDCGEFEKNMDMALKLADVAGYAARAAESRSRGKLRGLGIINAIEQAAGTAQPEYAEIRFNPSGTAALLMGTKNQGQGHETMFKQILHERLGIDPADVQFIDGDTDRVAFGMGTNGSRSTVLGGSALFLAAGKVIEKGRKLAGHLLEAGEQDIDFANGNFTVKGTDKTVSLKQVAMAAFNPTRWPKSGFEGGLYENATFLGEKDTYPNGCHICEVEIDPETGEVKLDRYAVVDDVGTVMNPIGLKGQIHGGVAQGVGQILGEQVVWDRESGQLLTASFLDYTMPRADTMCSMEIKSNPVPTKYNPLGAKGAGEAGTVGAMPVVMNAVIDALAPLGVKDVPMPANAHNVWRAIQEAKK